MYSLFSWNYIPSNKIQWILAVNGSDRDKIMYRLRGIFVDGVANLSDGGGGTLVSKGSTWTLTGLNTGSVTNLSGSFAGMANLSDTAAGTLQYPPGSTWTLTGLNTGSVTHLSGTFAGMTKLRDKDS